MVLQEGIWYILDHRANNVAYVVMCYTDNIDAQVATSKRWDFKTSRRPNNYKLSCSRTRDCTCDQVSKIKESFHRLVTTLNNNNYCLGCFGYLPASIIHI